MQKYPEVSLTKSSFPISDCSPGVSSRELHSPRPIVVSHFPFSRPREDLGKRVFSWTRRRGDPKVIHADFFSLYFSRSIYMYYFVNIESFWNKYLKINRCRSHPSRSWFWVTERDRVKEWDRRLIFLMIGLYKQWEESEVSCSRKANVLLYKCVLVTLFIPNRESTKGLGCDSKGKGFMSKQLQC